MFFKTTFFQITVRDTSSRALDYIRVVLIYQKNTAEVIKTAGAYVQEKQW